MPMKAQRDAARLERARMKAKEQKIRNAMMTLAGIVPLKSLDLIVGAIHADRDVYVYGTGNKANVYWENVRWGVDEWLALWSLGPDHIEGDAIYVLPPAGYRAWLLQQIENGVEALMPIHLYLASHGHINWRFSGSTAILPDGSHISLRPSEQWYVSSVGALRTGLETPKEPPSMVAPGYALSAWDSAQAFTKADDGQV